PTAVLSGRQKLKVARTLLTLHIKRLVKRRRECHPCPRFDWPSTGLGWRSRTQLELGFSPASQICFSLRRRGFLRWWVSRFGLYDLPHIDELATLPTNYSEICES